MSELIFRPTKTRRASSETNKFLVAHFAETSSQRFKLEMLEFYGAHESAYVVPCFSVSNRPRIQSMQ